MLRLDRLGAHYRSSSNSLLGLIRITLRRTTSILCRIISRRLSGTRLRRHRHRLHSIRWGTISLRIRSTRSTRLLGLRPADRHMRCSRTSTITNTSTNRIILNRRDGKAAIRRGMAPLRLCNLLMHLHMHTHMGSHLVNSPRRLLRLNNSKRRLPRQGVLRREERGGIPLHSSSSNIPGRGTHSRGTMTRIRLSMRRSGEGSMQVDSRNSLSREEGMGIHRLRRLDQGWARQGRVIVGWEQRLRRVTLQREEVQELEEELA